MKLIDKIKFIPPGVFRGKTGYYYLYEYAGCLYYGWRLTPVSLKKYLTGRYTNNIIYREQDYINGRNGLMNSWRNLKDYANTLLNHRIERDIMYGF